MTFENSEELHVFLNQNPDEIRNTNDIVAIIDQSVTNLDRDKSKEEIQNLGLEKTVFSFVLDESSLKPRYSYTDEQGHLISYPTPNLLSKKDIEKIDAKFRLSTSNIVKAHFGQFLWINGKRHTDYIEKAIAGYMGLINDLLVQNKVDKVGKKRNARYHYVRTLLSQLIFLSQKKRDISSVRQIILDAIKDPDHEFMYYSLALLMLETRKVFENKDYDLLVPMCLEYVENQKNPFQKISFYELGAKIEHRQNTNSINWTKLIGQQYELLANERKDLAGITFANKAARYYKEAGELEASERMAKLYKEKSNAKELGNVQSEIDITDYVKSVDKIIEKLYNSSIEEIIEFIRQSDHIIPQKEFIDDIVVSASKANTMRFFMGTQVYDSNGHIAQHFNTKEETTYLLTLENYHQIMKIRFEVFVNRLIVKLFDREDWTADNFLKIWEKVSWFGQEIHKPLNSADSIKYKLIELISPGIVNYFGEIKKYKEDNEYQPNFILSIDSLTLKIETILRELCILIGVRTFYIRKDNSNREVTKEKDINMLLREEKLVQFLGEDVTLYLKALLVERLGKYLRNKVAHGFLFPIEYKNFTTVNKVLVALLKLSMFEITGSINDKEVIKA